ncbi:hypothetical protein BX070DRAFT_222836 [Coemansia spiralis]|nr:hypothetical protein BX070DRAFT_222836 [Coemansia spiralis]
MLLCCKLLSLSFSKAFSCLLYVPIMSSGIAKGCVKCTWFVVPGDTCMRKVQEERRNTIRMLQCSFFKPIVASSALQALDL